MAKHALVQNSSDSESVDNTAPVDPIEVTTEPATENQKRRAEESAKSWAQLKDRFTNEGSTPQTLHDTRSDSSNSKRAEGVLTSGSNTPTFRDREGQEAMGKVPGGPKPKNNLRDDSHAGRSATNTNKPFKPPSIQPKTPSMQPFDLQTSSHFPSLTYPERDLTPKAVSPSQGSSVNRKSGVKVKTKVKEYQTVEDSMRPPKVKHQSNGSVNGSNKKYISSTSTSSPREDSNDPIIDEDGDVRFLSTAQRRAEAHSNGNVASMRPTRRQNSPHLDTAKDPKNHLLDNSRKSPYFSSEQTSRPSSSNAAQQTQTQQANVHVKRVAGVKLFDADSSVDELAAIAPEHQVDCHAENYRQDAGRLLAKASKRQKSTKNLTVDLVSEDELAEVVSDIKPATFAKTSTGKPAEKISEKLAKSTKPKTGKPGASSIENGTTLTRPRTGRAAVKTDETAPISEIYPLSEAFCETVRWAIFSDEKPQVRALRYKHGTESNSLALISHMNGKVVEVYTIKSAVITRVEMSRDSSRIIIHTSSNEHTKGKILLFLNFKEARHSNQFVEILVKRDKSIKLLCKEVDHIDKCFNHHRSKTVSAIASSENSSALETLSVKSKKAGAEELEPDDLRLAQAKSQRRLADRLTSAQASKGGQQNSQLQGRSSDSIGSQTSTPKDVLRRNTRTSTGNRDGDELSMITPQRFYSSADEPEPTVRSTRSTRRQTPVKEPSPPQVLGWSQLHPDYVVNWDNPLIYPRDPMAKNRQTIEKGDIPKLDDGEFLNDNLVNFGMRWLHEEADSQTKKRVYLANSFFYHKLSHDGEKSSFCYSNVARWTRQANVFDHDYIIIPVNENFHWYIAVICNPRKLLPASQPPSDIPPEEGAETETLETLSSPSPAANSPDSRDNKVNVNMQRPKLNGEDQSDFKETKVLTNGDDRLKNPEVQVAIESPAAKAPATTPKKNGKKTRDPDQPVIITLDSLGGRHPRTMSNLRKWLVEECKSKKDTEIDPPPAKTLGMRAESIPEQSNYYDCGVYCLGYVRKFLENPDEFVRLLCNPPDSPDTNYINSLEMREELRNHILALQEIAAKESAEDKIRKAAKRAKKQGAEQGAGPSKLIFDDKASKSSPQGALAGKADAPKTTKSYASPRLLEVVDPDDSSASVAEKGSDAAGKSTGLMGFFKNGVSVVKEGLGLGRHETNAEANMDMADVIDLGDSSPELFRSHYQDAHRSQIGVDEDDLLVEVTRSREIPRTPSPEPPGSYADAHVHAQTDKILESPGPVDIQTSKTDQGRKVLEMGVVLPPHFSFDFEEQSQDDQSSDPDLLNEKKRTGSRLERLSPSPQADKISQRLATPPLQSRSSSRHKAQVIDLEQAPSPDRKRKAGQQLHKAEVTGIPPKRRRSPGGPGSPVYHSGQPQDTHKKSKHKNIEGDNTALRPEHESKRQMSPTGRKYVKSDTAQPRDVNTETSHGIKDDDGDVQMTNENDQRHSHSRGSSVRNSARPQEHFMETKTRNMNDGEVVDMTEDDEQLGANPGDQMSALRSSSQPPEVSKRVKQKNYENGDMAERVKTVKKRRISSEGQPSPVRIRTKSIPAPIPGRDSSDFAFVPRYDGEEEALSQRLARGGQLKKGSHIHFT